MCFFDCEDTELKKWTMQVWLNHLEKDINKNMFQKSLDSDGNILQLSASHSGGNIGSTVQVRFSSLFRTFHQGGKQSSSSSSSSLLRISRVSRARKEWRDESDGGRRRGDWRRLSQTRRLDMMELSTGDQLLARRRGQIGRTLVPIPITLR